MELLRPETLPLALQTSCQRLSLVPGQRLFRRGDKANMVFVLCEGRLHGSRRSVEGREATMAVALPGDIVGEEALFVGRYLSSAIADSPTQLLAYPVKMLQVAIAQTPELSSHLMSLIGRKVQHLQTLLELRSIRSATLRLQQYFHNRGPNEQDRDDRLIHIEGTWKAIAAELSLTPQTLSKALAQLEKSGQIERRPDGIVLLESA